MTEQINFNRDGELLVKGGVAGTGTEPLMQFVEAVTNCIFVAV